MEELVWASYSQDCRQSAEKVAGIEQERVQEGFTEEVVWLSSEGWRGFLEVEVKGLV